MCLCWVWWEDLLHDLGLDLDCSLQSLYTKNKAFKKIARPDFIRMNQKFDDTYVLERLGIQVGACRCGYLMRNYALLCRWQFIDRTEVNWRLRPVLDSKRVWALIFGLLVSIAVRLLKHLRWIHFAWAGNWSLMRLRQHRACGESVLGLTGFRFHSTTLISWCLLILKSIGCLWTWLGTIVWRYHCRWLLLKYIWCTAS